MDSLSVLFEVLEVRAAHVHPRTAWRQGPRAGRGRAPGGAEVLPRAGDNAGKSWKENSNRSRDCKLKSAISIIYLQKFIKNVVTCWRTKMTLWNLLIRIQI